MKTIVIDNLGGPLTRKDDGDFNSGLAKFETSHGYDPYSRPGNLTWMEQPTSILTLPSGANSATIYDMKSRDENGLAKAYAIGGSTMTLYKIQVDDDPPLNRDSASVISTLSGSLRYESEMEFYGSTEKIFVGSTNMIERVNFDGSGKSILSSGVSSFQTLVPRPMVTFAGKLYFGNKNNIGEIDSTETITTAVKLSPALPSGVVVSDLDVTPDGNYLQITATKTAPPIMSGTAASNAPSRSTVDSYKFLWNGTDQGVTAFESFRGNVFFASESFGDFNYSLGRDVGGGIVLQGREKLTLTTVKEVNATGTYSISNTLGFGIPEYNLLTGRYEAAVFHFGSWDPDVPSGLYRLLRQPAQIYNDVRFVVAATPITGFGYSIDADDFQNNVGSSGKIYYSTAEIHSSIIGSIANMLWRFPIVPTGMGSIVAGVYETQTQLFSRKVRVSEVRVYTNPLVGGNDFEVDIIGSGGSVLSGASKKFAVGTNVTAGQDMVQYNPQSAPTYAVGIRITNASVTGVVNWTASKIEVDIDDAGK